MANKPTKPNYPLGLHSDDVSEFAKGLLNYGLIEHAPGAVMTVPEGSGLDGEISAIRYNASTDEFEGYYNDGWRTLGGGGGRWESATPAASYATEVGRGYIIDSTGLVSTLALPAPKKVGDSVSIVDNTGAWANYPLTVTGSGNNIFGETEDLVLATASMAATFTWTGDVQGWVITSGVGLGQGRVYNRVIMLLTTTEVTSHVDLAYKPDYLDIYAGGLRLGENRFDLTSTGIDFNPEIAQGVELQIIEYTPVNLASESGTNTFEVTSEAEMLALNATQGDMAIRSDLSVTYRLKANPANILANWISLQGGSSTFEVATQAAMLGLTAAKGDLAVRSDDGKTYRLKTVPASTLANWVVVSGVNSVNGRTGKIVVAEPGVNSDITSLKALAGGPLGLGGDGVADYDAVTLRQARNMVGGSTGPSMNGVMNFGVGGALIWESRAYIPPGFLPRDGQLVNRADYPELWAWAQMTTPITDAAWLADTTQRGKYSTGNGTTTFRLPDWNGVQSGSIPGVFFRGGNGAADMTMSLSAAPNIRGSYNPIYPGVSQVPAGDYAGALTPISQEAAYTLPGGAVVQGAYMRGLNFDASLSSAVYGRNSSSEVVPNKVSGVWLVRASGVFTAANSSFQVINSDATAPANGTLVRGGELISTYRVAAANYVQAGVRSKVTIGGIASAELFIRDYRGTSMVETVYDMLGGYLGQVQWHPMRSKPNPGTVAGDGQAVVVAGTYDNLKAAVAAGNFPSCTEAEWQANPSMRGCYVLDIGDGRMRLPDYNGVTTGSFFAPVLRGDGGSLVAGTAQQSAAPNIVGQINASNYSVMSTASSGALTGGFGSVNNNSGSYDSTVRSGVRFDASASDATYGRDSTTEVRMNSMVGCYMIRYTGSVLNAGSIDGLTLSTRIESVNTDLQHTKDRIGYALVSVTNPALNTRTVVENPFGNSTPVVCLCEIFHATNAAWTTTPWIWTASATRYGMYAAYSEGEGIVLRTANTAFVASTVASGASQEFGSNYATLSPVRIHVWKVTQ